jgi:hypothetical protein
MKTFAELNRYIGKADARLINPREGLSAVRNPNDSVSITLGNNAIIRFGTHGELTLNTYGQLFPKMLRLFNTYTPLEITLQDRQWFVVHRNGRLSAGSVRRGWQYQDGFSIDMRGEVEEPYRVRFDPWQYREEHDRVIDYARAFVKALSSVVTPVISFKNSSCPHCSILVDNRVTLGELDPTHLRDHIQRMRFLIPLLCRAVEKSSPRHRNKAVLTLDKYMASKTVIRYTALEKKRLTGILKNYILLELKYPITTNGI